MRAYFFVLLSSLAVLPSARAASDSLGSASFQFRANQPDEVLERTVSRLRDVFRRYRPALDSGTKIVEPLKVGGTDSHPTLNMVVKKCVFVVCETVEMDVTISLREVSGPCRRNYVIEGDLRRSSEKLSGNFSTLKVDACYDADGKIGKFRADAWAVRAPSYSGGAITNEILKMLKLQIPPMTEAIRLSLLANGADRAVGRSLR